MAGKTQSNGGLLSWTAGEPVVGLMTSDNAQLGMYIIPSLNVQALSKEDFTIDVAIKIYPNPTSNFCMQNKKTNTN
jgi:hypothetical protein